MPYEHDLEKRTRTNWTADGPAGGGGGHRSELRVMRAAYLDTGFYVCLDALDATSFRRRYVYVQGTDLVLTSFTGVHLVLLDFTGFYLVLLGCTGFY